MDKIIVTIMHVPVKGTEEWPVGLLGLLIAGSYSSLVFTYRLLTENCPACIEQHSQKTAGKSPSPHARI